MMTLIQRTVKKENKNIGETSKKKVQFMPDVTKHVSIVGTSSKSDGLGEEEIPKKRLKLHHQQIISPLSMASESFYHSEKSVAGSSSTLPPSPIKSDMSINKTSSTLTASEAESDIKLKPKRRRKPLPRYFGDCSSDDMNSPRRAKRSWAIATKTISQLKARVRKFRRENYILKSRVDNNNVQDYIEPSKEKSFVAPETIIIWVTFEKKKTNATVVLWIRADTMS
ncbi:hypothetical protein NQ314_020528 [Rhamnusium bicolor]|uniref:Uncharacterized protein n=1 Tax=Rhamnusium bicolor TaxID=1586634 RepID=A0AAV8WLE3_9CUCU|nr:hypothetical protein NQ314_020528 [Rhamnusium bicolor]